MRRFKILCLVFVATFASLSQATAEPTVEQTLASRGMLENKIFVVAMFEAFAWSNSLLHTRKQDQLFCYTGNDELKYDKMMDIMGAYVLKHPKTMSQLSGVILLFSLVDAFPCRVP